MTKAGRTQEGSQKKAAKSKKGQAKGKVGNLMGTDHQAEVTTRGKLLEHSHEGQSRTGTKTGEQAD